MKNHRGINRIELLTFGNQNWYRIKYIRKGKPPFIHFPQNANGERIESPEGYVLTRKGFATMQELYRSRYDFRWEITHKQKIKATALRKELRKNR